MSVVIVGFGSGDARRRDSAAGLRLMRAATLALLTPFDSRAASIARRSSAARPTARTRR
jgi:hypothetical protein